MRNLSPKRIVAIMVRQVIMKKNEIENFCLGDILFNYFQTPFFRPEMATSHLCISAKKYQARFIKPDT